jgi:phosphoglycerol transferase MdoB-like AlkP superfamily enzyme
MFLNLVMLTTVLLILSSFRLLHTKWILLVTLLYCLFIKYSQFFSIEMYLVSSIFLIVCTGYYTFYSKDVIKSCVFILPSITFKIIEILVVIGVIADIFLPTEYLLKSDYFLITSLLLLITLDITKFNFNSLEIKDFKSLIIIMSYTYCILQILF